MRRQSVSDHTQTHNHWLSIPNEEKDDSSWRRKTDENGTTIIIITIS